MHKKSANIKIESILFGFLLFVIFWAPLPFGSNRPWAAMLLAVMVFSVALAWLVSYFLGKTVLNLQVVQQARWPLVCLCLVQCWILFQVLPLPDFFVGWVSPNALDLWGQSSWVPLSLDTQVTLFYLLKSLCYLTAFFLVLVLVNSRRRVELLLWTIVLAGLFQTVYGSLMVLSGMELGFFVEKYVNKGVATGTFINRNHLAGFLVISLAAGTGLLFSKLETTKHGSLKELLRRWLRLLLSRKVLLRVFLALMVIGLVLTRSRMGNIAFFTSLAIAGAIALGAGRRFSPSLVLLIASLFVIDVWIVGQWFGFDKVVERLEQTSPLEETRVELAVQSGSILNDFPLTGSGGGAYYGLFSHYQGAETDGYFTHAHNDYLEIASDIGAPAMALLGIVVLLTLLRAIKIQQHSYSRLQKGVGFTVCMAICWLAMHSLVDFNMQIPANALTFSVILALGWVKFSGKSNENC